MIKRTAFIGMVMIVSSAAAASSIDIMLMAKANGLAEIMIGAKSCDYQIDQAELDRYFSENKLDSPEVLTFISNTVALEEFGGASKSPSECTIARATARKLGLLAP